MEDKTYTAQLTAFGAMVMGNLYYHLKTPTMPFNIEPNPGCRKWLTLVIVIIEERVSTHRRQDDARTTLNGIQSNGNGNLYYHLKTPSYHAF